jgi:hypothetical protein
MAFQFLYGLDNAVMLLVNAKKFNEIFQKLFLTATEVAFHPLKTFRVAPIIRP